MSKVKAPSESAIEMREMVMPQHANPKGTVFGGQVMAWVDIAASMAAARHCEMSVVTVSVDRVSFHAPVKIGEHVRILACCNYVGKTSMEIGVKVIRENPLTSETQVTTTAYLTFVALDPQNKPCQIPGLNPVSEDEKRRYAKAIKRREARIRELQS